MDLVEPLKQHSRYQMGGAVVYFTMVVVVHTAVDLQGLSSNAFLLSLVGSLLAILSGAVGIRFAAQGAFFTDESLRPMLYPLVWCSTLSVGTVGCASASWLSLALLTPDRLDGTCSIATLSSPLCDTSLDCACIQGQW